MKALYVIAVIFCCVIGKSCMAQAPYWEWAKSPDAGMGVGKSVTTDIYGHAYVTGNYSGSFFALGGNSLYNIGSAGVFVAKYDTDGNVLWAKSSAGQGFDGGNSICSDPEGNVYVTGYFSGPFVAFGTTSLINADIEDSTDDIFLIKYDPKGNVIWAKCAGGTGNDYGQSVSADAAGNVYIAGIFTSPYVIFGSDTLTNTELFITKYDSSGNVLWVQGATGEVEENTENVSADAFGNVYLTGYFYGDSVTFDTLTIHNPGYDDYLNSFFLVKFDPNGHALWGKCTEINYMNNNPVVSTDAAGNVYLAGGFFARSVTFGNVTLANSYAVQEGSSTFIVKYNSSGNVIWAKSPKGTSPGGVYGYGLCADNNNNVYLTGYFTSDTASFDDINLRNSNPGFANGLANPDIFVVKYDSTGTASWAKNAAGKGDDIGISVCPDAFGNIYLTGQFSGYDIIFGQAALADPNPDKNNFFISKIGNNPPPTENTSSGSINVYPNPSTGNFFFNGISSGCLIEVYNVLGEMVYSSTANSNPFMVDMGLELKGVFFYRVRNNATVVGQGKIVVFH